MRCFSRVAIGFVAILLFLGPEPLTARAMTSDRHAHSNPLITYGNKIEFDVFRDGEKVGKHIVRFKELSLDKFEVTSRLDLQITFLKIPVYDYAYFSNALWKKGRLIGLTVSIDDDGEKSSIHASTQRRTLVVVGPKGKSIVPHAIFPTNHWNAAVLRENQVLNTLSGEISQVKITKRPIEKIRAEGRLVTATKYQYTGDIETNVWYDDKGRWVKMRFRDKGGSIIDYECTACGIGSKRNIMEK